MHYEFVAIPDEEVSQAADPLFRHLGTIAARGFSSTAAAGQEQLLQPHRHGRAALQHRQGRGPLTPTPEVISGTARRIRGGSSGQTVFSRVQSAPRRYAFLRPRESGRTNHFLTGKSIKFNHFFFSANSGYNPDRLV